MSNNRFILSVLLSSCFLIACGDIHDDDDDDQAISSTSSALKGSRIREFRGRPKLIADRIGAGDQSILPDGKPDKVFDLVVRGPVKELRLALTLNGTALQGVHWDTAIGDEAVMGYDRESMFAGIPFPTSDTGFYFGNETSLLGVEEDKVFLSSATAPVGDLVGPLTKGRHALRLYASPPFWNDYYTNGERFGVDVEFADGTIDSASTAWF